MGQLLHMLPLAVGVEHLQSHDNAGMERPPPTLQEAPIGHLVGEGVPEGVDLVWEALRLIEELPALQGRQHVLYSVLRQFHEAL
jgi:hypothetical protein